MRFVVSKTVREIIAKDTLTIIVAVKTIAKDILIITVVVSCEFSREKDSRKAIAKETLFIIIIIVYSTVPVSLYHRRYLKRLSLQEDVTWRRYQRTFHDYHRKYFVSSC